PRVPRPWRSYPRSGRPAMPSRPWPSSSGGFRPGWASVLLAGSLGLVFLQGIRQEVGVVNGLSLPWPIDRPPKADTVLMNEKHRRVPVLAAQVGRCRSPLPLSGLGQVEQENGVGLAKAEVLQPEQVAGQCPAVDVLEADVLFASQRPPAALLVPR